MIGLKFGWFTLKFLSNLELLLGPLAYILGPIPNSPLVLRDSLVTKKDALFSYITAI